MRMKTEDCVLLPLLAVAWLVAMILVLIVGRDYLFDQESGTRPVSANRGKREG